nr:hypothetical protein [Propionicimonas sp.]
MAVLPPGWTVRTSVTVGGLSQRNDASLQLVYDERVVLEFVVEVKRALTRRDALAMQDEVDVPRASDVAAGARRMVVSRYLAPQAQEGLRERGIAYADATGNVLLTSADPLILVSDRGATADPWRGPGRPTTSLKGLPAALLVRALVDYAPPYTVPQLADAAGASLGAAYRLVDYLADEGILSHTVRGPIASVDWTRLLRQWSQEASVLASSATWSYLEPRGMAALVEQLRQLPQDVRYALSGSLAAQPYAPYAEPRLALLYTEDPPGLASALGLRPVDTGANVVLASPRSPAVFERTSDWLGATIVAPSQAVADLLGGPGRNPAEGDYLLNWMEANTDDWRRQLDR